MKLSQLIKELENIGAIYDYFLHRDAMTGSLEMNIIFNNKIADEKLYDSNIKISDSFACWE